jgi:hypothetical protein
MKRNAKGSESAEEDAEEDKKRFFHRRAAKVPSFKSWDEGGVDLPQRRESRGRKRRRGRTDFG